MNHLTEEQMVLHYYAEAQDATDAGGHLEQCETCRAEYRALEQTLARVDDLPVPEREPDYASAVWRSIEREVASERRARWPLTAPWKWVAGTVAFASLLVAAFLAGRVYERRPAAVQTAADPGAGERAMRVAVGDYLERSQMVLVELANSAPEGRVDITSEQQRAGDLVSENRLYRQTAARTGHVAMANLLEELERVLLDITHAPSEISPQELEELRQRLEAEGILFKIRVLGSNVRKQDQPASREKI